MNNPQLAIRAAEPADLAAVLRLLSVQLAEHAIDLDEPVLRHAVAGLMHDPRHGRILIARLGEEPVGVAVLSFLWTLEHGGMAAWLDEVYVEPALRDRGIGRRLIEAAIDLARTSNCIAVDLEVESDHAAVERLYQRMGFRRHQRARWVRMLRET